MSEVTIRKLHGDEMLQVMYDLAVYAFGTTPPMPDKTEWFDSRRDRPGVEYWVVYQSGRPAAGIAYTAMTQNLRGKLLSMGGVWGVAASPETRRQGYVRQGMAAALAEMREKGMALSTLYPFRESFYQRLGYTSLIYPYTASFYPSTMAAVLKMKFNGSVERTLAPDRINTYRAYLKEMQARVHGMSLFDAMDPHAVRTFHLWLLTVKEDERVTGQMLYHIIDEDHKRIFKAERFYYAVPQARYQMLEWIARHIDQVAQVKIHLAPFERPETWMPDLEMKLESDERAPMGRVVDIYGLNDIPVGPGRFTARISDPTCPWNEGAWRFESQHGCLKVERAGNVDGSPISIQGLSSWLYGVVDPGEFSLRGWGEPTAQVQAEMRSMLPLAQPYLHQFF